MLLSNYIDRDSVNQAANIKKAPKGKRELCNLAWDMKDGSEAACSVKTKRLGRGKSIVNQ